MYVPKSGKLQKLRTETNHGTYVPLVWKGEDSDVGDSGILELEGDNSGDTVLLLFGKKNDTRILKVPDDTPTYADEDVYRLYWAYDTEKLYMNIGSVWTMIGTLNHDLLSNRGTLTHAQLEEALYDLQEQSNDIALDLAGLVQQISSLRSELNSTKEEVTTLTDRVTELEDGGGSSGGGSSGGGGGSSIEVSEGDVTISAELTGTCYYTKTGNLLTINFNVTGDLSDLSTIFSYQHLTGYFPVILRTGWDDSEDDMVPATLVCVMGTCYIKTPPGRSSTGYIGAFGSFTVSTASPSHQMPG